jgi:hypothetical protein
MWHMNDGLECPILLTPRYADTNMLHPDVHFALSARVFVPYDTGVS